MAINLMNIPKKINIGCGYKKIPEYLNVDIDAACDPDFLLEDHNISILPDNYFDEVLAWDVLEHIPHLYTMHALLDWSALLRLDGALVLQTSSIFGVVDMMRSNPGFEIEYNWTRCLFGSQAHAGDFHHCGFTERTLKTLMAAAGFHVPALTLDDGWLFGCVANKIESWTDLLILPDDEMFSQAYRRYLRRDIMIDTLKSYLLDIKNGASRRALLRDIVAAPEHLYKLGAMLD